MLPACRHDKQLVSHDIHTSNYNYKYTFSVEIAQLCKVGRAGRRDWKCVGGMLCAAPVVLLGTRQCMRVPSRLLTPACRSPSSPLPLPPPQDDLVCLPAKQAAALGNIGPLVVVTRVTNALTLTDPLTLRQGALLLLGSTQRSAEAGGQAPSCDVPLQPLPAPSNSPPPSYPRLPDFPACSGAGGGGLLALAAEADDDKPPAQRVPHPGHRGDHAAW